MLVDDWERAFAEVVEWPGSEAGFRSCLNRIVQAIVVVEGWRRHAESRRSFVGPYWPRGPILKWRFWLL